MPSNSSLPSVHIMVVVAAFGASFAAGAWIAGQRSESAPSSSAPALEHSPAGGTGQRGYPTDEEMLGAVMSAMVEEDPLRRAHELHSTLGRLSSSELAALLPRAIAVKDNARRHALLVLLLTQWMDVDATTAREALRPYWDQFRNGKGVRLAGEAEIVLKAWAAVAPDEVFEEVVANVQRPGARILAEAALAAMAGKDPQRQFDALARLPASPLRDALSAPAIKALAQNDYSAGEAHLDLLSGRQRVAVHAEILEALAKRDPAAGLAHLTDLAPGLPPSTSGLRLMAPVLQVAASGNREAAFALVAKLPEALQSPRSAPFLPDGPPLIPSRR